MLVVVVPWELLYTSMEVEVAELFKVNVKEFAMLLDRF